MGSVQLQDFVAGLVGGSLQLFLWKSFLSSKPIVSCSATKSFNALHNTLLSFLGIASVVAGHPLDTVKCESQCALSAPMHYIAQRVLVLFTTEEGLALKAKYTLFTYHEPPLGWKNRNLITFYKYLLQTRLQAGQGYGNTLKCVLTVYRNESLAGFFKGMSFPLASIGIYSSVVFGVFSNTQRFLSQLRHGDPAAAPSLADMTLASVVAGVISVGIGTPVELVKIRLQMQTQPYNKANVKLNSTVPGSPVYRGPIHCLRTILQKEGIAGIYRGNVAMLLRDVPGYCAYFIPYAMFCDWITPDGSISPNTFSIWVAGGVAGKHLYFLSVLAKQEQEGSQGRLRGSGVIRPSLGSLSVENRQCLHFPQGSLPVTLPGICEAKMPPEEDFNLCWLSTRRVCTYPHVAEAQLTVTVLFSMCTLASKTGMCIPCHVKGAVSWAVCTPMDVVKSRLQADGVYLNQYKGILDCMLQSYQKEGLKVFCRGLMVNTMRGFPSSAAMFLGYELSLKAMKRCQTETSP
ncbi:hypothetical protein Nmel_014077 [Mimus melanotis]